MRVLARLIEARLQQHQHQQSYGNTVTTSDTADMSLDSDVEDMTNDEQQHTDHMQIALSLVSELETRSEHETLPEVCYAAMIRAYGAVNNWASVMDTLNSMVESSSIDSPTSISLSAGFHAASVCGKESEFIAWIDQLDNNNTTAAAAAAAAVINHSKAQQHQQQDTIMHEITRRKAQHIDTDVGIEQDITCDHHDDLQNSVEHDDDLLQPEKASQW